MGLVYNFISC
jgi:hypothetical protein